MKNRYFITITKIYFILCLYNRINLRRYATSLILLFFFCRSHPNGVFFQIMYPAPTPVVIGIKEWIELIRSHSKQMLTSDGESVNKVGRLLLFLDSLNFTIQGTNQSDQETHFVTPPMPTTLQPVVFGKCQKIADS